MSTQAHSNHPHPFPFVIQGFSTLVGSWQDSRHGGATREEAEHYAHTHGKSFSLPNTRLRVVPAVSIKPETITN
jgi:hypothetical protein